MDDVEIYKYLGVSKKYLVKVRNQKEENYLQYNDPRKGLCNYILYSKLYFGGKETCGNVLVFFFMFPQGMNG